MITRSIYFSFLFSLFVSSAFSQAITRSYVDYNEKATNSKTAAYYVETHKTAPADNYWQRKMYYNDTTPAILASTGQSRDQEGLIKEGSFVYFQKNGKKQSDGSYINNIREGEWKQWNESGNLSAVNNYKNAKMIGRNISWYDKGQLKDSAILDEKGNGKVIAYYEDGGKRAEGHFTLGDKNGTWLYYYSHVRDQKSMEANYEMDSVKAYTCYTQKGEVQNKDCFYEREAAFKGADEGWRNYLIKKLTEKSKSYTKYMRPNQMYTVIVKFVVNNDGEVVNIRAEKPDVPELDEIAIKIIEASPKWIPAIQYNRKVNAYRRQPITFSVGED